MDIRDVEASAVSIEITNERSVSVPEAMEKISATVEREGETRKRVGYTSNEAEVCIVR